MTAGRCRLRLWPLRVLLLAVLLVWFNQGVTVAEYQALEARAQRGELSARERLQQPLRFAYRRAYDEELYYALSSAMLGQPADQARIAALRAGASTEFLRPLPPADGRWHAPYREVPLEYPPLVLPALLAPRLLFASFTGYARCLSALMGLCLWLAVEVQARAFAAAGARRWVYACAIVLLLAHGSIAVQRLDALLALALASAALAWRRRRYGWVGLALGAAAALKLLPALWLLPALAADRRLRAAWRPLGLGFGAALGLGLAPLLHWDPSLSLWRYHAARGLHVESLAATVLASLAPLGPARLSFGSLNLDDPRAWALAAWLPWLTLAALASLCLWLVRRAAVRGASGPAALLIAAVLLTVLCGKVFSPQYLTWIVPLIGALGAGGRGRPWLWALAGVGLSQLYLRGYYDAVYQLTPLGLGTLWLRDVALLVLLALCLCRLRRAR